MHSSSTTLLGLFLLAIGASAETTRSAFRRRSVHRPRTCFADEDCALVPNASSSTCTDGQCNTTCNTGFSLSSGQCYQSAARECSGSERLFNGQCLSAPTQATSITPCSIDDTCTTSQPNAFAVCQSSFCSVVCQTGYAWDGQACSPDRYASPSASCQADRPCAAGPLGSNLIGKCDSGKCSSTCATGFKLVDGRCTAAKASSCAQDKCLSILHGTSSCDSGRCTYSCLDGRAKPIVLGSKLVCVNSDNDTRCCGDSCKACPTYSGAGSPTSTCSSGVCGLACQTGLVRFDQASFRPICTERRSNRLVVQV